MKVRLAGMLIVTAVLAGLIVGIGGMANAQDLPKAQFLNLHGKVTIDDGTAVASVRTRMGYSALFYRFSIGTL